MSIFRKKISRLEIIEIIKDRIDIIAENVSLNVKYSNNTIYIFNNKIDDLLNNNRTLYILIPGNARKNEEDGSWEYDISSFKIHAINKDFFISKYHVDELEVHNYNTTCIALNNDTLIYSSDVGISEQIDMERSFNLREQACLMLQVPKSGTPWLDNLIIESLKNK